MNWLRTTLPDDGTPFLAYRNGHVVEMIFDDDRWQIFNTELDMYSNDYVWVSQREMTAPTYPWMPMLPKPEEV